MANEIVRHQPLTPEIWRMIEGIAPTMKESRLFGMVTAQQAAAVMLKGHELGLSLTASFDFINVIKDKPTLIPRGALALIIGSSEYDGMKIEDITDGKGQPTACKVWMKRKNGLEYTATFSMEDAKRADLIKPDSGWAKYPANMLRWRAIGFAADIVFPDVLGGMKRADELGADLTPDGEVIRKSWQEAPYQPKMERLPIQDLLDKYTPDTIIAAANGSLPQTQAECDAVAAKLEAELNTVTIDAVVEVVP